MLVFLEHHDAGALAHDEAVAVLVLGPRGAFGGVSLKPVDSARAGGEAGDAEAADRRLGAAGDHHVGVVERDQPRRVADRVRAGRAGRDDRVVRALEAVADRDMAGGEVDQADRDEERRDRGAGPFSCSVIDAVVDAVQAADARADHDAGALALLVGCRASSPKSSTACVAARHREEDERRPSGAGPWAAPSRRR